jgi:hypothetical protein
MIDTLIWAGTALALGLTIVIGLLGPYRRFLRHVREGLIAETAAQLARNESERMDASVRRGSLIEETEAEKARLRREAEEDRVSAEAAALCLDEAVAARRSVIQAVAEGEVAAALDDARRRPVLDEPTMKYLNSSYALWCHRLATGSDLLTFNEWLGDFQAMAIADPARVRRPRLYPAECREGADDAGQGAGVSSDA